ncbi:hypothetical protein LIER_14583 [Lithospermum erythrorhizon]|uniref:Retrovirus-related Pol polyprotein from transposon TNT 1-94 n=1 Tax=Lithospermum erythrorhizon TaxID=34254 RepID=A0AAV3Q3T8_LITER
MKNLGLAKKILGMQIIRDKHRGTLQLSQSEYIKCVEEDKDYMAKVPYASAIRSLMYAMVCTRPNIGHAMGIVSRYMSNSEKFHWEAIKWILRYLRATIDKCLYFGNDELKIQGYIDADFGGEVDHRKSTTDYIFTVGNTSVSWMSQLQKIVALSTTEAEYVAITKASKEVIWLRENEVLTLGKIQEAKNPTDMLTKTVTIDKLKMCSTLVGLHE